MQVGLQVLRFRILISRRGNREIQTLQQAGVAVATSLHLHVNMPVAKAVVRVHVLVTSAD